MKFSLALLALCAAQTGAFSVQGPSVHPSSALNVVPSSQDTRNQNAFSVDNPDRSPRQSYSTQAGSMQNAMGNAMGRQNSGPSGPNMMFDNIEPVVVQGGSLRTFSFSNPAVRRVKVSLRTNGRPLNANVDLWQGPDNAPQKMSVYIEDGSIRPFSAVIETPRGHNAIALRNTGQMEFPLDACVEADMNDSGAGAAIQLLTETSIPETVQGGAIKTYSFEPSVASVQILLKTDGRPLNARIELLQGPNNNKQVVELYAEDGLDRPFYAVIETPGVGNVVRIVNTAPVEFPMSARVEPYMIDESGGQGGWDSDITTPGPNSSDFGHSRPRY